MTTELTNTDNEKRLHRAYIRQLGLCQWLIRRAGGRVEMPMTDYRAACLPNNHQVTITESPNGNIELIA